MGTPDHAAVTGFAITADEARQLASGARAARLALAVGVPIQTLAAVGQIHQWRARQTLDNSLVGFLAEVPVIVVGVLFVIWFHRAATVASRLSRPARRTPGWAVGGWLIPIGNLYIPYQSALDLFRPAEPDRATVKRWWLAYLVAVLGTQTVSGLAGFADETIGSALVAVGALAFVLWLWAYVSAGAFIDTATASLTGERATLPQ